MAKRISKFMLNQLKPYKWRITFISSCMVIVVALGILTPLVQQIIFDDGIIAGDFNIVLKYIVIIVGLFLAEELFSYFQFSQYERINRQISIDLMYKAVEHSIDLKVSYHQDNNFAKTISNVYSDIQSITNIISNSLLHIIISLFRIIGGIVGLIIIDWRLTIFILSIIPLEIITKNLFSKLKKKHFVTLMKLNESFSIWFSETFKCIEIIKLWNIEARRKNEFLKLKKEIADLDKQLAYIDNFSDASSRILSNIFTNGLTLLGAILILRDSLTIGGLFAFTAYTMYVIQPIAIVANISFMLKSSVPAFNRYIDYFDNDVETSGGKNIIKAESEIKEIIFENVIFNYNGKAPVLRELNFSIKKGEKVAFVGANGSGKTSITNLLLRFFEPQNGHIKLNGMDIKNINLSDYRDLFSVMLQNPILFDTSIKGNVNITNDLTDQEIHNAMNLTTASDFIESLPDGIETSVGYNGSKLSGGEKQKVALARVLAKKSKILILDEATGSFDLGAEVKFDEFIIQSTYYEMIIIISHRVDILRKVDKIFIIENGTVADIGTFDKLINSNENFKKILTNAKDNAL